MGNDEHVTGEARQIPRRLAGDAEQRLRRLRGVAWWLDRGFGFGDKARFGLDPLIGLIPGIGDWLGGGISLYVVYQALRLGVSWPVIGRMMLNVLVESVVGAVPLLGDAFDFVWQANYRNLQLVERNYHPRLQPRSLRGIGIAFALIVMLAIAIAALSLWAMLELLQRVFAS